MRLLNVGCGGQRPQDEFWYNLDTLRTQLDEGTPERKNLDAEPRYIECDILTDPLPFGDEEFDGILLQHVLEHMTCHEAVECLKKCRRILMRRGSIMASVPDADYFRKVHRYDTIENAKKLFGEPIHDDGHETFMSYALFRHDHKQLLTTSSLKCLFLQAGFDEENVLSWPCFGEFAGTRVKTEFDAQLSRRKFSAEVFGIK